MAHRDGAELTVLAFPGGSGTASCIREARRWHRLVGWELGVAVQVIDRVPQEAAHQGEAGAA